jgi:hypothetical protein
MSGSVDCESPTETALWSPQEESLQKKDHLELKRWITKDLQGLENKAKRDRVERPL